MPEAPVEEDLPVRPELREPGLVAPTDQEVAIRQPLHVALVDRDDRRPVNERTDEGGAHSPHVQLEHDPARLCSHLRSRLVVEQRQRPVRLPSRIVLPGEPDSALQREVASLSAEPPEDPPRAAVELVHGVRVAG